MPRYSWDEISILLDDISKLPTLPTVMINAINIAFDPSSDMNDLYKLLRNDPAITAQILKVVNSSYYGTSRTIESLKTAMVVLGMDEVVNIVSAVSMADTFKDASTPRHFDLRHFWLHSVAVGETAQLLRERSKLSSEGELFTAGLLHDIGCILLATYFPEDYDEACRLAREQQIPLHQAERELLGVDHARIGEYLARRWNLPDRLVRAIRHHHAPQEADPPCRDAAVIYLADVLSSRLDLGLGEWLGNEPIEESDAWKAANRLLMPDAQLSFDVLKEQVGEEMEKAKEFVQLMMF